MPPEMHCISGGGRPPARLLARVPGLLLRARCFAVMLVCSAAKPRCRRGVDRGGATGAEDWEAIDEQPLKLIGTA